tara:strand:+ start:1131 stop:1457 length:327 start_codon:yes stop_codon:yes gene_type:complete
MDKLKSNGALVVIAIIGLVIVSPAISTVAWCVMTLISVVVKLLLSGFQVAIAVVVVYFLHKVVKNLQSEGDDDGEEEDDEDAAEAEEDEEDTVLDNTDHSSGDGESGW